MRRLDRKSITAPSILVDPGKRGETETEEAKVFFRPGRKKRKGDVFEFKAYSDKSVKAALIELSGNNCSYCECEATAGFDGDIEHFRPKGMIIQDDEEIVPGYYWLAADWKNLYLSCIHCNQARTQVDYDGEEKTVGKMNQFPLSDPTKRVRSPDQDIEDEEEYRLLIDPCRDNPGDHLVFLENGRIEAARRSDNSPDPKGVNSIKVFALYRKRLTEKRMKKASKLVQELESLRSDFKFHLELEDSGATSLIERNKMLLDEKVQKLKLNYRIGETYSEMCYQIISKFLAGYNIKLPR